MGKKLCIDAAREDDSLGRLINDDHVSPNSRMRIITVARKPHLCLFAIKDIRPGEEITYNYGDSDWPWRLKVSTEAHPHHAAWASDCTKDVKQLLGERESPVMSCPDKTLVMLEYCSDNINQCETRQSQILGSSWTRPAGNTWGFPSQP
ncbi:uncharacterized protein [Thunnus thynnus]|uniref:uncharacterized protein isoform X2 n=1 Tax=Thunnus thynnus TaxID=8237 RepID=UPI003528D17E